MRNLIILVFCLSLSLFSFRKYESRQQYKLIPDSSQVVWYCQEDNQLHSGSIMFAGGEFTLTNNLLTGGSFELDMASLADNDLRDAGKNAALVSRLKSADFFNASDYPRAKFVITQAVNIKGQQYMLEGNLTLKGQTRPVQFPLAIAIRNNQLEIVSSDLLLEGVQFGLKTGVKAGPANTELKDFKVKIAQLFAK